MKTGARGFLLIEGLVAIVIIAVAVTAALTGIGRSLELASRSESFTETALPLEALLFEIETGAHAGLVEGGGQAEYGGREFEVESAMLGGPAEEEKEDVISAPPIFSLKIRPPETADFYQTEILAAQEMFS